MTRHRIVIDTDPGVDDAIAILLALASPEIELLGLSVVAGNVPLEATLANACKIVSLSGRMEVPIHAGAPGPLVREQVYGKYAHIGAFSDALVPAATVRPQPEHAVDFLVRIARRAAADGDPVTICAVGPMTNLALALVQHPDVARGIRRIVSMGGAFTALGHRTPWAEYNIYADPHAAEIVYSSGVPIVAMPLDVTFQALITEAHIAAIRDTAGAVGEAIAGLLRTFDRSDVGRFGRPGGPVHDAMTVAWLLQPEIFTGRPAAIGVAVSGKTAGHTWGDFHGRSGAAANALVMGGVDEARFLQLLVSRLGVYGRAGPNKEIR